MPERSTGGLARDALLALLIFVAAAAPLLAGQVKVQLSLPLKAKLDLSNRKSIAIAPFLVVHKEGEETANRKVDVQAEFERYIRRLLTRETHLKILDTGPVTYPTYDLQVLIHKQDFWQALGTKTGADLLLTGSLDFDIQDRSGYRTEQYVSPLDGRTYYRQVLVENTGFEYDIVLAVFDGHTGKLLYSDNFKDFKNFPKENASPLVGMFENLSALQDRIAGIFTEKRVKTIRTLFTE
ncbi:MAG TPA: hypothetical protein VKA53_10585 [Thermoanaerobaculia bacterium]|nr:hypothetical protein [Thermoanaerobaculia bacterium]